MKISILTNAAVIAAACSLPAFSATLIVNKTPFVASCPAQYSTIQAGVNAAKAGDIVYVCAGTYNEQVTISKNISLVGQTGAAIMPSNAVVNAAELYAFPGSNPLPAAAIVFVHDSANVTVSGLIVDGTNAGLSGCGTDLLGIYYQNAGGTIAHDAVRYIELGPGSGGCQAGLGILAEANDGSAKSIAVTANSVHDYQKDGIDIDTPSYKLTAQYNIVRGFGPTGVIGQNGLELDDAASNSSVTGNNISQNSYICPPEGICYASTDIINFVNGLTVNQNVTTGADVCIYYAADEATISSNSVSASTEYDGIYLEDSASDTGSTVTANTVTNTPVSIEINGASSKISVTNNTLIEAVNGILNDNSSAITNSGNKYFDVTVAVQNGFTPAVSRRKASVAGKRR